MVVGKYFWQSGNFSCNGSREIFLGNFLKMVVWKYFLGKKLLKWYLGNIFGNFFYVTCSKGNSSWDNFNFFQFGFKHFHLLIHFPFSLTKKFQKYMYQKKKVTSLFIHISIRRQGLIKVVYLCFILGVYTDDWVVTDCCMNHVTINNFLLSSPRNTKPESIMDEFLFE